MKLSFFGLHFDNFKTSFSFYLNHFWFIFCFLYQFCKKKMLYCVQKSIHYILILSYFTFCRASWLHSMFGKCSFLGFYQFLVVSFLMFFFLLLLKSKEESSASVEHTKPVKRLSVVGEKFHALVVKALEVQSHLKNSTLIRLQIFRPPSFFFNLSAPVLNTVRHPKYDTLCRPFCESFCCT